LERRAARLDSPGTAQGAPSPPQAVASREPEPDPSPPHLRPLAHRVTTSRPDPPAQSTLEDYGLSDPIIEPDPGLHVETVHRLPVPARPIYELYYKNTSSADNSCTITHRLMHNTLNDRVVVWTSFGNHPRGLKDRIEVASPYKEEDDWVLDRMLPEHRWYTASPIEHQQLRTLRPPPPNSSSRTFLFLRHDNRTLHGVADSTNSTGTWIRPDKIRPETSSTPRQLAPSHLQIVAPW
jgi:hypothetical protein